MTYFQQQSSGSAVDIYKDMDGLLDRTKNMKLPGALFTNMV